VEAYYFVAFRVGLFLVAISAAASAARLPLGPTTHGIDLVVTASSALAVFAAALVAALRPNLAASVYVLLRRLTIAQVALGVDI
jgi:hypothetical protein